VRNCIPTSAEPKYGESRAIKRETIKFIKLKSNRTDIRKKASSRLPLTWENIFDYPYLYFNTRDLWEIHYWKESTHSFELLENNAQPFDTQ